MHLLPGGRVTLPRGPSSAAVRHQFKGCPGAEERLPFEIQVLGAIGFANLSFSLEGFELGRMLPIASCHCHIVSN
jgi:hypothetical protein